MRVKYSSDKDQLLLLLKDKSVADIEFEGDIVWDGEPIALTLIFNDGSKLRTKAINYRSPYDEAFLAIDLIEK